MLQSILQDDAPQFAPFLQQGVTGNTIINREAVCSLAISNGAVRVMSLLLAQGTDANVCDSTGETLLMKAARNHKPAMVELLLAHGADVNATDKNGNTALISAVVMSMPSSGGMENDTVRAQVNAQIQIEAKERLAMVQKLIQKGANINARNSFGRTPLMEAAYNSKPEVIDFLLAHGADVNATDKSGETALCYASGRHQLAMAQSLIKRGASVNIQPRNGPSPLVMSVFSSNVDMLRLLLAHGGDPNEQVKGKGSLLHYARKFGDQEGKSEFVQTLILAGAKE